MNLLPNLLPTDDRELCGVGPFSLPSSHPFTHVCALHDEVFTARHDGTAMGARSQIDKNLLTDMLNVAKANNSISLRAQAYAYYGLAHIFGWIFW